MLPWRSTLALCALAAPLLGCHSPYASDRLAGAGALLGGGAGAIIGSHGGHAAEGALIGAALGAAGGAVTGGAIDNAEARNRAVIESRLGRPVPIGAVTVDDVVAMTRSGVPEEVIVSHIESRGMAQAVGTGEIIYMQNQGVRPRVLTVAQRPPRPVVVGPPPHAVVVAEPHYGPPCWHYPRYYCRPPPVVGFGFSYHHHRHK
jgi:hypothetical protein